MLRNYFKHPKSLRTIYQAAALTAWIARDDLPLAGMVVPIGIGFAENNV
ncbi:hypothetical protein [Burkholderia ubonensis]|nr:hypothetical protein [Burkholderia ubonensis]